MIIDVHTHIFPENVCSNRETYFKGEAAFKLLYDSPKSRLITAEELIAAMDKHGIDKSVTFGFPWVKESYYRKNNDYILESVRKYPDRLIGLCCMDIYDPGAEDEVKRCLDAGLLGVGELAFYQSGIGEQELKMLEPVMEICAERNVPVMIHTNEPVGHIYPGKTSNTLKQIYNLAKKFSENKIIFAHWGGGLFFYTLLKKEVKKMLQNVYFDTAASPFLYSPEIYEAAASLAGPEKILLGTDYPLITPERYFKEIETTGLSKEAKKKICGGNAAAIFNL